MPDDRSPDYPHDQDIDDDPLAGFEAFWDAYPRRDAKKDAQKAWRQIKAGLDPVLRERIMQDITRRPWSRERRFVMLPATYLRGDRWTDEAVTADAVPISPANRWHPSNVQGGRIQDGHQWCAHDPICSDDMSHIRKLLSEKEGAE